MPNVRWFCAGLCLLAVAAPAVAQSGQYDSRDTRDSRYDRDSRSDRYDRDDRDDRYRDDRYRDDRDRNRDRDRDDRRGDRWNGGRPGGNGVLPGGSWSQSCRRASMSGNTLVAQCKAERGKWRDTRINPRSCQTGRVGNRFGTLACE